MLTHGPDDADSRVAFYTTDNSTNRPEDGAKNRTYPRCDLKIQSSQTAPVQSRVQSTGVTEPAPADTPTLANSSTVTLQTNPLQLHPLGLSLAKKSLVAVRLRLQMATSRCSAR